MSKEMANYIIGVCIAWIAIIGFGVVYYVLARITADCASLY